MASGIEDNLDQEMFFVYQHRVNNYTQEFLCWTWKILCKIKDWFARTACESIIAQQNGLTEQTVRLINSSSLYNTNDINSGRNSHL